MLRNVEVETNSDHLPSTFKAKLYGHIVAGAPMMFFDLNGGTSWVQTSPVQYIRMFENDGEPFAMVVKTKHSEYRIKVLCDG